MSPIEDILDFFIDPIYYKAGIGMVLMPHMIMKDPVIGACGHTYERLQIEGYLKKTPQCPLCKMAMTVDSLLPNIVMKQAVVVLNLPSNAKLKNIEDLNDGAQIAVLTALDEISKRRAQDQAKNPPIPDRLVPPQWFSEKKEPTVYNSYNCYGKSS